MYYIEDGVRLFSELYNGRTRGNGRVLNQGKFSCILGGGNPPLEQVSAEISVSWGISIFRDVQNLTG